MGKRLIAILLLASVGASCGPSAGDRRPDRPVGGRDGAGGADGDDEPSDAPPGDVGAFDRSLRAGATWADLLALARRLDDRRADASEAGCLLRGDATRGFRLEADLAVTVRPLAQPQAQAVAALSENVSIVSRWGAHHAPATPETPRLVGDFTLTRPWQAASRHVVVGIARERVVLIDPGAAGADVAPRDLAAALRTRGATHVHVIADADVALSRVANVLDELDTVGAEVALSVLLPEGARAPEPERAGGDGPPLCADGLPDPGGDATPDTRELLAIRQSLGPLRQAAERCQSEAMSAGIGAVDVLLAFRIEPDGTVPEACVVEESRPAAALRRCLSGAARGIAFPVSAARGPLVLELPLSLRPSAGNAQRARCP